MIRPIPEGGRRVGASLVSSVLGLLGLGAAIVAGTALLGAASCASLAPPFSPSYQGLRGYKARTFVGTPAEIRPAVVATLEELGYEVLVDGDDQTFLSAVRGMGQSGLDPAGDATGLGGQREWTRVGVQIRHVDKHRRAPRTLIEIEAERMQGTADGPIEASFGAGKVPSDFYQGFFASVGEKVERIRPRSLYGLRRASVLDAGQ
ncbi:MAG: hypothetical protein AAFU73_06160 [Planctomycetota bacterium]